MPVLYLRNFTDANGALHVVNRSNGHRRESSPEAIGFEKDLYWPGGLRAGEDPETYENQFREFEGKAAPVIQRIKQEVDRTDRVGDAAGPRTALTAHQRGRPFPRKRRRQFARGSRVFVVQMRAAYGADESNDLLEPRLDDFRDGVTGHR